MTTTRVWGSVWGYLSQDVRRPKALLVVDWGGAMEGDDLIWQRELAEYLSTRPLVGSFYGTLDPNPEPEPEPKPQPQPDPNPEPEPEPEPVPVPQPKRVASMARTTPRRR